MAVDKMKLFESTRDRWPPNFRIAPTDGVPSFNAEPDLLSVYQRIEASCEPIGERTQSDEWAQLANWSFHQSLWALAEDGATERMIRSQDVTFEMFDHWLRFNLADESWAGERREYEDSPSRFH